jgi:hypothetical protein
VILSRHGLACPTSELEPFGAHEGSNVAMTGLDEVKRDHILRAHMVVGTRNGAAERLRMKRTSLVYKMQKYASAKCIRRPSPLRLRRMPHRVFSNRNGFLVHLKMGVRIRTGSSVGTRSRHCKNCYRRTIFTYGARASRVMNGGSPSASQNNTCFGATLTLPSREVSPWKWRTARGLRHAPGRTSTPLVWPGSSCGLGCGHENDLAQKRSNLLPRRKHFLR